VTKSEHVQAPKASKTSHIPENRIAFTKTNNNTKSPFQSTPHSAGLDLLKCNKITIQPGQRTKIFTGIKMEIPSSLYGRIAPRSGLSLQYNIDVADGIIDSDYRGELFPILVKNGSKPIIIFTKHSKIYY